MSQSADVTLDRPSDYLATPIVTDRSSGPWPGVVVVHDAFGVTDDMREQADWLAAAGYIAVVPDLYAGRLAVRCIRAVFAQLGAQEGQAFDQIASIRSRVAASADCTVVLGNARECARRGLERPSPVPARCAGLVKVYRVYVDHGLASSLKPVMSAPVVWCRPVCSSGLVPA